MDFKKAEDIRAFARSVQDASEPTTEEFVAWVLRVADSINPTGRAVKKLREGGNPTDRY